MRYTGVTARGIVAPMFKEGDDLAQSVVKSILDASKNEGFTIADGDIVGITESVVARTQGNYATCEQIASDIRSKLGGEDMGIVFPILSRNRFSILLKAIAMSTKKLYVQLSYPSDEVGNQLIDPDVFDVSGINGSTSHFTYGEFRKLFDQKATVHPFTGIDYIEYYKNIGGNTEIVFSNDPAYILQFTKNVLNCDIHTRKRTQRLLKQAGAARSCRLDEILTSSVNGSGFNADYGLLGSNMASGSKVKLFPRDPQQTVDEIAQRLRTATGRNIDVLIYGDGAFKDPVGRIWELADPVVSPAFTDRLNGTMNELKLKYLADNEFAGLKGDDLVRVMKEQIRKKDKNLVGSIDSQGTTPRRIPDLLGSLCDLISGSGDRGTPIVLIQGYFTNFASE